MGYEGPLENDQYSIWGQIRLCQIPINFRSSGIRNLISKALFQQNVRPLLKEGQKRHDFKTAHGFRKYFKTQAEQTMMAANVEMLIGHDLGIWETLQTQEKLL